MSYSWPWIYFFMDRRMCVPDWLHKASQKFFLESWSHHLTNNTNPFIFDISFVCKWCRRISAWNMLSRVYLFCWLSTTTHWHSNLHGISCVWLQSSLWNLIHLPGENKMYFQGKIHLPSRPLLPPSYSNGVLSLLSVYWLFSPLVNRPHGPGRQLIISVEYWLLVNRE